jgi:cell division protein FtsB
MFGLSSLYLKLAGFAVLVLAIGGGYWYVDNLRDTVEELKTDNRQLSEMNETLSESMAEIHRMQEVRDEVSSYSDEVKVHNQKVRDNRESNISEDITAGKDRPVGPLLKEFFNDK